MRLFINIFLAWVFCTALLVGWRYLNKEERIDLLKCAGWGLLGGVVAGVVLGAVVIIF